MITVYHFEQNNLHEHSPEFMFLCSTPDKGLMALEAHKNGHKDGEYRKVAEVETDDLDKAFELTNTIDKYWGRNDGVRDLVGRCRSTSCGDIMEKDGVLYVVMSVGFLRDPREVVECPLKDLPAKMGLDPYWDEIIEARLKEATP